MVVNDWVANLNILSFRFADVGIQFLFGDLATGGFIFAIRVLLF
ncbi:protein of unknown function, might related with Nucleoside permease [Moritella yayanosii]|uniref:Uncharacterized protein n=1 Tax=Moritella yayanosii TaxID=69539 RepID=A0A330LJD8_9GAMM|nr:protein of unknown function, might related with Nucleoside permease [Moritella yayanosii]